MNLRGDNGTAGAPEATADDFSVRARDRRARPLHADLLVRVGKWCSGTPDSGNALIHGDNLAVLEVLAREQPASVRCAYLDPPYNNGDSYGHYDDSMGHDLWLAEISQRLSHVHALLRADGSVWISIDDSELHYLKVAADQVFGRKNFVGTIVWERRTTRENRKVLSRNHEYLLVYAKALTTWSKTRNPLDITESVRARYQNLDGDPRGPWQSVSANVQAGHATAQQYYTIYAPNGREHQPPKGRCWVYPQARMLEEISRNNIWFGRDGNSVPRIKTFLADRQAGLTPETLWRADDVGTTAQAKKHLHALFRTTELFDTPKPEPLLERILRISTCPGDLVLDPYLGSGTTASVAHKMARRYIGIERGDHIMSHCVPRLRQVIAGESGGVSKSVEWKGGGGFEFFRLRAGSAKRVR